MDKTFQASLVFLLGLLVFSFASAAALSPSCLAIPVARIQLCMVIDGSGSIIGTEWNLTLQAVARGVTDTIPHDGSIELTVIQFGYLNGVYARTEVAPVIIENASHSAVAQQILSIGKMGGSTPTAFGVYLGWQELRNSPRFSVSGRQVINLATDSKPSDNVRNNNATSDLDGSGGQPTAADDLIAVVNDAVNQGLDELDIEGINLDAGPKDWFRNWVVRPQPGAVAPPFSKAGWIRFVENVTDFANTLDQKLQAIISVDDVWSPSAIGAFFTGIITIGVTSVISAFASAVTNPETFPSQMIAQRVSETFPDTLKKWLSEFISSKRKLAIGPYAHPPFTVTKLEAVSYAVSLSILTFAFTYVKAATLNDILIIAPTVLATSIIVEFTKNYVIAVVARIEGVWTEHRLWYFGLTLFLFSSLVFRVPFSSPSRLTHNAPKFTQKSMGLVSAAQVLIAMAFAAVFFGFFINGYTLIGNIGIVMCLTMAFFDSIPIPPMNGKDIYDWSKVLWTGLFTAAFTLYMLMLFVL